MSQLAPSATATEALRPVRRRRNRRRRGKPRRPERARERPPPPTQTRRAAPYRQEGRRETPPPHQKTKRGEVAGERDKPAPRAPPDPGERGEAAAGRDKPSPGALPDPAGHMTYLSVAKDMPPERAKDTPPDGKPPACAKDKPTCHRPAFTSRWTEIQRQVEEATARRRDALAKSHPFRDRGAWHPPSRRHANGRRRGRANEDSVGSVDRLEAALPRRRSPRCESAW